MAKKIISKVIVNKRTGQLMIFPSKKKIKIANPKLRFGKHLFVRLEFLEEKKR